MKFVKLLVVIVVLAALAFAVGTFGGYTGGGCAAPPVCSIMVTASTTVNAIFVASGFSDSFNTGTLNPALWVIDTGTAPGGSSSNSSSFSAANVDLSQGMLALKLTQTGTSGAVVSTGAEVRSVQTYGFGTYTWTMRAGSAATSPSGGGTAVSGGVTGAFNFVNNSQTEIDFEYEGQFSTQLEMTNFNGIANSTETNFTVSIPDQSFHTYQFVWSASSIVYSVDGVVVSTHTTNIPSAPAYFIMNHWGTNSATFGGTATIGTTRWVYISKATFTPS